LGPFLGGAFSDKNHSPIVRAQEFQVTTAQDLRLNLVPETIEDLDTHPAKRSFARQRQPLGVQVWHKHTMPNPRFSLEKGGVLRPS